jgi:hypothetical protein
MNKESLEQTIGTRLQPLPVKNYQHQPTGWDRGQCDLFMYYAPEQQAYVNPSYPYGKPKPKDPPPHDCQKKIYLQQPTGWDKVKDVEQDTDDVAKDARWKLHYDFLVLEKNTLLAQNEMLKLEIERLQKLVAANKQMKIETQLDSTEQWWQ